MTKAWDRSESASRRADLKVTHFGVFFAQAASLVDSLSLCLTHSRLEFS